MNKQQLIVAWVMRKNIENLLKTEARTKAKEQLSKDSSDNNTTIELLLDREMRDFKKLKRMYPLMSEEEKKILERLLKDYDCWFSTILILYQEEIKDRKALKE